MFERLTADKVYLNSIRFGIQVNFPPHCGHEKAKEVDDFVKNVFDRLAAYEDTGLTPEQVQELKVSVKICEDCWNHAQAKAEGRLVELPVKVGDIVYVASGCLFYREDAPCTPCEVVVFKQGKQRGVMMHLRPLCEEAAGTRYHRWFPVTSIGKTVFLTRAAAEKALGVRE